MTAYIGRVDGELVKYELLPEQYRNTVRLYIEHGYRPGSAWAAIFSNELRAILLVEDEMVKDLSDIMRWMINHAPAQCWGSRERVHEWMNARFKEREGKR